MPPPSAGRAVFIGMKKIEENGRLSDIPCQYKTKDGRTIDILIDSTATVEPSGKKTILCVVRNVTERKRLERELLDVVKEHQRVIGQELHDGLGQQLTGIAFISRVIQKNLESKAVPEASEMNRIASLVNDTISQARALAKGLYPVELHSSGLSAALQELAAHTEKLFKIKCQFRCSNPVSVYDNSAAMHLYRIAQESVNNALKHGKADDIIIELAADGINGTLTVKSNGRDYPEIQGKSDGMGLKIMQYRADVINGFLNISRASEGGTVLSCTFPMLSPSVL